jgi:TonB family protein
MPPTLETPPNPVEPPPGPTKLRTGRFGELEEHELVHLLDSLDDERSKARFRESIYISLFFYIIVAWFLIYGPRVLFHQPVLINPVDVMKQRDLTNLETPADIARRARKLPAVKPTIDQKTLEAMRRATAAAKPAPEAPKPAPPQPATPPPPVQQAQQTPLPSAPRPAQPAPPALAAVPDAPKPRPDFGDQQSKSAGDTIRDAMQGAAQNRGGGGEYGNAITPSHVGVGTGVDILSDTMGVNFDPYLKKIMRQIYNTWIPLIPEEARPPLNKQGVTQIRFMILPDGRIGGMVLEGSTHDDALNRAAWGSITGVGQFPPLPKEFHGPNLELRIHYLVNQKQE